MNRFFDFLMAFLFFGILPFSGISQGKESQGTDKMAGWSSPEKLRAPPEGASGFPSLNDETALLENFRQPPMGYGQVPFWWWTGDPLDKERLLWQIKELHDKGIPGMQVNYSHTREEGWPTDKAEPDIFSEAWWEFWRFVAAECDKRDMGIGLSGYTIDWPRGGENLFKEIIYSINEINGKTIEIDTSLQIPAGGKVRFSVPANRIAVWAYPLQNGQVKPGGKNLEPFVRNGQPNWTPREGQWQVITFIAQHHPGTLNPIHPDAGKTVIEKFFQPFEENTRDQTADGLNYFFQDELDFGVGDCVWTDDLNAVFKEQKGYDLFEILPALFGDLGEITPKTRLDFMDVKMQLAEERYFKPIFDWHWSRGKIYGCDPGSRGRNPAEFGDYFRSVRWYTAPGHDTPGGHADLIKGKVSSSIAGLYRRPRVWLEGYHSLGWQAAPERLLFATSENYLYGCNLLNLHGLYYTTHGSFWEWAPPSYHFRMPYWDHMEVFLNYFDRLSFLLSQGELQADIAVMYPVSPMQADMKRDPKKPFRRTMHHHPGTFSLDPVPYTKTAFESGTELFNNGYDFIFMDHQSLARVEIEDRHLKVPGGSYKVLVLPDMKAVRWTTIRQALRFYENGGTVVAVGELPGASDRAGRNDPELNAALEKIFGTSATPPAGESQSMKQTNQANGIGMIVQDARELTGVISTLLKKHVASGRTVRAMHRKAGNKDIYMIMGTGEDSWCTFQSTGKKMDPLSRELILDAGIHRLLLRYDSPGRGHFVLEKTGFDEPEKRTPLSMKWWDMPGRMNYNIFPFAENPAGWVRFNAPPGLKAMQIKVRGDIRVWIDGQPREVEILEKGTPATSRVVLPEPVPYQSKVAIRIRHAKGWYGGSAFPHPILLDCEKGITQTGNWSGR